MRISYFVVSSFFPYVTKSSLTSNIQSEEIKVWFDWLITKKIQNPYHKSIIKKEILVKLTTEFKHHYASALTGNIPCT